MATVKIVLILRSIFTGFTNGAKAKQYILDCISYGSAATLFKDSAIAAAFYTLGTGSAGAIQAAIDT